MNRSALHSWFRLSAGGLALLLVGAAVLLVATSWRGLQRLQPLDAQLTHLGRVQHSALQLQENLLAALEHGGAAPSQLDAARTDIHRLMDGEPGLAAATRARLQAVDRLLARLRQQPDAGLTAAVIEQLQAALSAELDAHRAHLRAVEQDTRDEFQIAVVGVGAFLLLAALGFGFLRRRVQRPLGNLTALMAQLAERDYRSVPTDDVAPLLRPLFANYNRMVERLARLQEESRARRDSLERDVRGATEALLEQQRTLGRAERLAAVGEVAASLAHELRNPLAGMQMALANLRHEVGPAQGERLDRVIGELRRIVRLLNAALDQARQRPEPSAHLRLRPMIEDLLALARYQISPHIALHAEIPEALQVRAPPGQLRQAVLNLVLNAAQAMEGRAGEIRIRAETASAGISLQVCDHGPGFSRELLESGVRAFGTWREDGTGLGLAMVRRFAHDLGGELRLANRDPHGACATVLIPQGSPDV